MDPLAHTLVGATLAETGLRRRTPLATATLIVGANAPDIDAFATLAGRDAMLGFRRGITHGALAMVVLPLALTAVMLGFDRLVRRRRRPDAAPARAGPLLGLAFLSVLTHPALDWLNTYGVRLLMPFDGRWFYGDTLLIIDPWLWLLMAAAVVLARSQSKLSIAAWVVLGSATTALVLGVDMVPLAAKGVWLAGVAAIVGARVWGSDGALARRLARGCAAALVVYLGLMIAGTQLARAEARSWLASQRIEPDLVVSGPVPANPLAREVIVRAGDTYHFVRRGWLEDPGFRFSHPPMPVGPRNAVTRAALDAPGVNGLATWLRLPAIDVEPAGDGHRVTIRDVRYARREGANLGHAVVHLDADLAPIEVTRPR